MVTLYALLPSVWFVWDELLLVIVVATKNRTGTIVTAERKKQIKFITAGL